MHPIEYAPLPKGGAEGRACSEELFLIECGAGNNLPRQLCGPAPLPYYALCFLVAGKGALEVEGRRYTLDEGDIVFLCRGCRPHWRPDKTAPWRCAWVCFGGEHAEAYLGYAGFSQSEPVRHSNAAPETYCALIEAGMRLAGATPAEQLARTSFLYGLLSTMVAAQHMERGAGATGYDYSREVYVDTAKEYIAYHYANIKITDLAKYLGVNRSYLTVVFKKETGLSPQEYLVRYRLEKAAELLQNGSLSLRQVACKVGYADPFTFSKVFKSHYGQPPSVWRQAANTGGQLV